MKIASSKTPGDDSQAYPQGIASYQKKETLFNRLIPYGLCSLEPAGTFVLLLSQDSVKFGIPAAMQNRFKNLAQGEVVLYNAVTKDYVYLKNDGTIEIKGNPNIIGDLTVTGDLKVTGDAVISGISFLSHVHGGVETGLNRTLGPE